MKLERIAPDYAYEVEIAWTRPIAYDRIIQSGSPHDTEGWLYMIVGYHGSSHPKIFHVGKVFDSCVSDRLRQRDHRTRYERLRKRHPRDSFRVSLGAVKLKSGHITSARIDQIENILIFATYHSKHHVIGSDAHMINKSKWYKSGWPHPYVIRNVRNRTPLSREIHSGVFIRR
jgi:hypothetical protein